MARLGRAQPIAPHFIRPVGHSWSLSASDSAPSADSANRLTNAFRTAQDALSALADSAIRQGVFFRSANDALTISDVARKAISVIISDVLSTLDQATRSGIFGRVPADSTPTTDTAGRSGVFGRTPSDTSPTSDVADRRGVFSRLPADLSTLSDSVLRQAAFQRSPNDAAPGSDTALRHADFGRSPNDRASTIDVVTRLVERFISANEVLTIIESAYGSSPNISVVIGDFIPTLDSGFPNVAAAADLLPVIADSAVTTITRMRVVIEQLPAFGEGTVVHGFFKRLAGRFAR